MNDAAGSETRPPNTHRPGQRRALDLPVELSWDGVSHQGRTALVSGEDALVLSPVSWPLWAHVRVRNLETGIEVLCRVEWCRGDATQTGGRYRLALKLLEDGTRFWGPAYPERVC